MPILTIKFNRLTASVDVPDETAWELLRYASGDEPIPARARERQNDHHDDDPRHSTVSAAAQIREVVAEVLSDGRHHERRELAKVVRERGLSSRNLDNALRTKDFERGENVTGRPTYRLRQAESPGDRIAVLGTLGGSEGTNGRL